MDRDDGVTECPIALGRLAGAPPLEPPPAPTSARRDDPASAPSRPPDEAAGSEPGVRTVGTLFLLSASFLWGAALTLLVT